MPVLEREEYIEQAYFFQSFRERVIDGIPSQDVLAQIGEEILSTTKLPIAIGFMNTEAKVSGLMSPAMKRLGHYFAPFQAFVIEKAEEDAYNRFPMDQALLVLEREARYRAEEASRPGLFVYQFETISRNRLGYGKGLDTIAADPFYDEDWRDYITILKAKLGDVDFADLIYARSAFLVAQMRRRDPNYTPKYPTLFGEKEGKIARANRGRDPLYLFSALQRQLGYPEVPRPKRPDESVARMAMLEQQVKLLENRVKLLEADVRGEIDLSDVQVKPEDTAGTPFHWGLKSEDFQSE